MGDFQVSPAPNINFISLIPKPTHKVLFGEGEVTYTLEREREIATNETLIFLKDLRIVILPKRFNKESSESFAMQIGFL